MASTIPNGYHTPPVTPIRTNGDIPQYIHQYENLTGFMHGTLNDIAMLRQTVSTQDKEIANLRQALNDHNTETARLRESAWQIQSEYNALSENSRQELAELRQSNEEKESTASRLRQEKQELARQHHEQLQALEEENAQLRSEAQATSHRQTCKIEELEKDIVALTVEFAFSWRQAKRESKRADTAQKTLVSVQDRLSISAQSLSSAEDQLRSTRTDLIKSDAIIEEKDAELQKLHSEAEELAKEQFRLQQVVQDEQTACESMRFKYNAEREALKHAEDKRRIESKEVQRLASKLSSQEEATKALNLRLKESTGLLHNERASLRAKTIECVTLAGELRQSQNTLAEEVEKSRQAASQSMQHFEAKQVAENEVEILRVNTKELQDQMAHLKKRVQSALDIGTETFKGDTSDGVCQVDTDRGSKAGTEIEKDGSITATDQIGTEDHPGTSRKRMRDGRETTPGKLPKSKKPRMTNEESM